MPAGDAYSYFAPTPVVGDARFGGTAAPAYGGDARFGAAPAPAYGADPRFGGAAPATHAAVAAYPPPPVYAPVGGYGGAAAFVPPVPAAGATSGTSESGLGVATAIGIAGVGLLASYGMQHWSGRLADPSQQLDTLLRRALVVTLGMYVVLGLALLVLVVMARVRLSWHRGSAPMSVLLGLGVGAVAGEAMLGLSSALNGHLTGDSRVELLVGGGGALRIALAFTTVSVLAPLIEETLFRGILAGSLMRVGLGPAVLGSAFAFAAWHMNAAALPYYTVMGLLIAWVWRARGLLGSMSAHAAFNGVLLVAAVVGTSGAGHLVHAEGLSMQVSGGWQVVAPSTATPYQMPVSMTVMKGPGGAALLVMQIPTEGRRLTAAQVKARIGALEGASGLVHVTPGTERLDALPAGQVVEADVTAANQRGHVAFLPYGDTVFELVVLTGSSPAAEHGWPKLLHSITVD